MFKKFSGVLFVQFLVLGLFFICGNVLAATNLLTNPGAETGSASGWSNVVNGGNGWFFDWETHRGSYSFDSSYTIGSMDQEVDLLDEGYSQDDLDALPDIAFSSWIYQRGDHSGEYYMIYELRDADHNVIASHDYGSSDSPVQLSADTNWFENAYMFTGYSTSTRYVYVKFAGQDTGSNWSGAYGPHFDDFAVLANNGTGPNISTLTPADGVTGVLATSTLTIEFDQDVTTSTGNIVVYNTADDSVFETIDVTGDSITRSDTNKFVIDLSSNFSHLTDYYVLVDEGAFQDVFGNDFAGISSSTTWNFTGGDMISPTLSNFAPSGTKAAGTTSATLSLRTSEAATCKYSSTSGTSYSLMTALSTTGNTSHSFSVSGLENGTSYNYYILCRDSSGNESGQATISFSVANPGGALFIPPPIPQVILSPVFSDGLLKCNVVDSYQMAISQTPGFDGVSWQPYVDSYKIDNKKLYIKFRNKEGGVSEVYIVDQNIPQSIVNEVVNDQNVVSSVGLSENKNKYVFSRNLKLGMKGEDVKELQRYLNKIGFVLVDSGYGALGQETDYFGKVTQNALIRFQQAKKLPAYGYFGSMTRSVL